MPPSSETCFKEKVAKFRHELTASVKTNALLHTLKEMQSYVDVFPDESNQKICAAHLGKELVDWIARLQDAIMETDVGKAALSLLEHLLQICHKAQDAIKSFCVVRLYNVVITLNANDKSQKLRLRLCYLMSQFPITNERVDLFKRMKRVALKTVQDWSSEAGKGGVESQTEGIDLLIEMQRKLLVHAAESPRAADNTRPGVLDLFREIFDTSMAILYRIFTISRPKARELLRTVMETMTTVVKPDEFELISLLNDAVGFLESIVSFSGDDGEYLKFAQFLDLFSNVNCEPYKGCFLLLRQQVQVQQVRVPSARDIHAITARLQQLADSFASHPLVVKVAVFISCQGTAYFNRLPQEMGLSVAAAGIDLFQLLISFVRHCPAGTVQELCRKCTSSRRHLADRLITALVQLCIYQVKDALERKANGAPIAPTYSVERVCELLKKKLSLLEELGCERKRLLIDNTMRQSVTWLKYTLILVRDDPKGFESAAATLEVLKVLITTQHRHRFDCLSDLHLVRLLENCYIERPTGCTASQVSSASYCWSIVSVRLLKLLLVLRDSEARADSEKDRDSTVTAIVRSIMFNQVNAPEGDPIRSLHIAQLYEHAAFDRHGFAFDCSPTRDERFLILFKELNLAVKYKTSGSVEPWEYFQQLRKLCPFHENPLAFGMALYSFSEKDMEKIPTETMEGLYSTLTAYEPANSLEGVQWAASMGMSSYHSLSLLNRASLNRLRDVNYKTEHFRNNQIDELLVESQLDHEAELMKHMESIRVHYGEMLLVLAREEFGSSWVIPSVVQIAGILENTARYFQLNYYPHRAVELQLLNFLLVSQCRENRPLEQCVPLGFLLEQHRQTEELMRHAPPAAMAAWPERLGSLEQLAVRADNILASFSSPPQRFTDDVPEDRKFHFLNLYLGLAIYHGSMGEFGKSLELIRRSLAHLPDAEDGQQCDVMGPITPLMKGRTAQIIFRLVAEYGLPWPGPESAIPPVFTFLKLMLTSFNELQKLANQHTFVVCLATVEMTVAVLQYLLLRYDTSSFIESYVDQLLKFVLRRGAGLRVIQILLLYGHMCADLQKLDRCEITLSYLNRLLMLPSALSGQRKPPRAKKADCGILLGENNDHYQHFPLLVQAGGVDNNCDDERKAVPKHCETSITPAKGWAASRLEDDDDDTAEWSSIEEYLMFRHTRGCDCRHCRSPQYKSMAFQAATLAARLFALKRSQMTSVPRTDRCYRAIVDHWLSLVAPALDRSASVWCSAAYRADLVMVVVRMFVQWGQFQGRQQSYDSALEAFDRAILLTESERPIVTIDPALLEDIKFNRSAMEIARSRSPSAAALRENKKTRAMLEKRFRGMIAKGASSSPPEKASEEMQKLGTQLNNLVLQTPTGIVPLPFRGPHKTVDPVNELIRQAATRRHQLKKTVAGEEQTAVVAATPAPSRIYSASARKPKAVSIFVDSPPGGGGGRSAKIAKVPATVGKIKLTLSSKKAKTVPVERISVVDLCSEEDESKSSKASEGGQCVRAGKRALLLQDDLSTPAKLNPNLPPKDTYKNALVNSRHPLETTPARKAIGRRPFVVNDFPSLSESSDTDASIGKTPQMGGKSSDVQAVAGLSSPAAELNGSFRDALLLGGGANSKLLDARPSVIVLDDSSGSSDAVVESSFVACNDPASERKNTSLSYSDRKRLLVLGSSGKFSSARSTAATQRRTPIMASKTRLRFDEPGMEQKDDLTCPEAPVPEKTAISLNKVVPVEVNPTHGEVANARVSKQQVATTRRRAKNTASNEPPANIPSKTTRPSDGFVATRTRQRRKLT